MRIELHVNNALDKGSIILRYELFIKRGNSETMLKIISGVKLFQKIFKFTASLTMTNTIIRIYCIAYYALS